MKTVCRVRSLLALAAVCFTSCKGMANGLRDVASKLDGTVRQATGDIAKSAASIDSASKHLDPLGSKLLLTQFLNQLAKGDSLSSVLRDLESRMKQIAEGTDRVYYRLQFSATSGMSCRAMLADSVIHEFVSNNVVDQGISITPVTFRALGLAKNKNVPLRTECVGPNRAGETWIYSVTLYQHFIALGKDSALFTRSEQSRSTGGEMKPPMSVPIPSFLSAEEIESSKVQTSPTRP